MDELKHPVPSNVSYSFPRPIYDPGLTQDFVFIDKSPEPGIIGLVPIVSHYKVFVGGTFIGPKLSLSLGSNLFGGHMSIGNLSLIIE